MRGKHRKVLIGFALVLVFALLVTSAYADEVERVIVKSSGSRDVLKQTIQSLGGKISHEYQNVNAVAASVPTSALVILDAVREFKVMKDMMVPEPLPRDPKGGDSPVVELEDAGGMVRDEASIIHDAAALPADYTFNNALIRANTLHAGGNLGQGVMVAVIDSGTANNSAKVPSLSGTVVGGQSFVPAAVDPVLSATSTKNGSHGTWVGTMIAGHAAFLFSNTSCLARSVALNAPDSIQDATPFGFPGFSIIRMTGVAPGAKIYALKVFSSKGGGAPESRIIAAMDRALTMKKNFLAGQPSVPVSGTGTEDDPFVFDSLNIQVVNMSLGGPTLFAGRDLEDVLTQEMLAAGITLTASAGNAGPSGLTTGSPSTGLGSLSVAASNTPAHERILRDQPAPGSTTCRLGRGLIFRPSNALQTAFFSSRGPTADGRVGVDLISAGFANFVQGASGGLSIVSGTSFSAPTAAGAAALLQKASPSATATQIRNALIAGANPSLLGDQSTRFDQGHGYLDVVGSLNLLQSGSVSDRLPINRFSDEVEENLEAVGLRTRELEAGEAIHGRVDNLVPGQRREFFVEIPKNVASVQIDLASVTPELPPSQQNQLFGDDVILSVHQAKTSEHGEGDYPVFTFANAPATFTINNPEPGFMRVTFSGDWTNAGRVSAEFVMTASEKPKPTFRTDGTIADGQLLAFPFAVPSGLTEASFELTWKHDWSAYPTNDLDLILIDPDGVPNFTGATLNGLERAVVKTPKPGTWTILVDGFTIFGKIEDDEEVGEKETKTDKFRLQVFLK